ncbi:MAG: patatin-like phospholipase family protein [Acidimicrobiales bacterium]
MKRSLQAGTRIGLVLGAGGSVGCAYHAGVLYSLLHHTGWDARDAESIVGTSAGSLVGALLRSGVDPEELAILINGGRSIDVAERLRALHHASEQKIPMPSALDLLRAFRPPTPQGLLGSVRYRSVRPALLSMMRSPRIDLRSLVEELDHLSPDGWPERDLRICTVEMASGRRRVLTGDAGASLSTAVAASCAVPGLFAPQKVGRHRLMDGGVHSVTNIDVLPFDRLDEVWVIAPMAGAVFQHFGTGAMRKRIAATLRHELRSVPRGMRVRLFEPQREASGAMGLDLMATDRAARTVLAGFLETGDAVSAAGF